jgi:hypothetical protein
MVPEEHAVRSGVFGVRDVALALGLTPRQLKNAISAGALPAPDPAIPSLPFALAAFDEAWMDRARLALAADPQTVREAPYKPRPIVRTDPAPGVKEVDPARIKEPGHQHQAEDLDKDGVKGQSAD